MNDITIGIKTFNRKKSLWRLLQSLEKYYPLIKIIIVDDSKYNYKEKTLRKFPKLNLKYIVTDFDIGLSSGRNILIENTITDYFVLCDDDFEFDERTNIIGALELLINKGVDILAGTVLNKFSINTFHSFLWALKKPKRFVDVLTKKEVPSVYNGNFISIDKDNVILELNQKYEMFTDEKYYNSDIVSNFFISKTKSIKSINGWQPENIKIGEHQIFYYRAKMLNLKIAYSNLFSVNHYPLKTLGYNKYRLRSVKMTKESFEYYGVTKYTIIDKNKKNIIYQYENKNDY